MMMTTQEAVDLAAAGELSPVTLFWDYRDPSNQGPIYRYNSGGDSGSLNVEGWVGGNPDGICVEEFFDHEGNYYGPDGDGIHPSFVV